MIFDEFFTQGSAVWSVKTTKGRNGCLEYQDGQSRVRLSRVTGEVAWQSLLVLPPMQPNSVFFGAAAMRSARVNSPETSGTLEPLSVKARTTTP